MKLSFAAPFAPLALIWFLSLSFTHAQNPARPAVGLSAADAAWQSLTTLRTSATSSAPLNAAIVIPPATPAPSNPVSSATAPATPAPTNPVSSATAVVTSAPGKAAVQLAADRSRQLATAAKIFYTTYPTHANASEARKIEVLGELRGIKHGDALHETKAMAIAAAFRADLRHPQPARVEVAFAMDRAELSRRIQTKEKTGRVQERIRVGDRLRAEFGDIPEYHTYTMEVARTADLPTALRLATEAKPKGSCVNSRQRADTAGAKPRSRQKVNMGWSGERGGGSLIIAMITNNPQSTPPATAGSRQKSRVNS